MYFYQDTELHNAFMYLMNRIEERGEGLGGKHFNLDGLESKDRTGYYNAHHPLYNITIGNGKWEAILEEFQSVSEEVIERISLEGIDRDEFIKEAFSR